MPVIKRQIEITASAVDTFEYLSSHEHVSEWMFGVTSFVPVGHVVRGLGARYEAEMKLGPKTLRSTLDVVEWDDGVMFALASVDGFDTNSRWSVESIDDAHCRAEVEFVYDFPGGITGRAMAKIVEPFVAQGISMTDRNVRHALASLDLT